MSFYDAFELVLEEKNLKVADICQKTGIHPSYFSKLKNGYTKDVTWEKALIIIAALDMTPTEFAAIQEKAV